MERNYCSWRQAIKPGEEVTTGDKTIKNETKNTYYLCNALIQILDPNSPFFKLIGSQNCGLLEMLEENCPIAKKGFSQNYEIKGRALNEYISLVEKQTK